MSEYVPAIINDYLLSVRYPTRRPIALLRNKGKVEIILTHDLSDDTYGYKGSDCGGWGHNAKNPYAWLQTQIARNITDYPSLHCAAWLSACERGMMVIETLNSACESIGFVEYDGSRIVRTVGRPNLEACVKLHDLVWESFNA